MQSLLRIRVSRREADRPRLLQVCAVRADGCVEALKLRLEVDENGTFDREEAVRMREVVTAADGCAVFQWYEWPRSGPARDFTSDVRCMWDRNDVAVYLEDLYE